MSTESFGVDGGEIDDALVLRGQGLKRLCNLFALLSGLGEDVGKRNASLLLSDRIQGSDSILHTSMYPA